MMVNGDNPLTHPLMVNGGNRCKQAPVLKLQYKIIIENGERTMQLDFKKVGAQLIFIKIGESCNVYKLELCKM